MLKSEDLKSIKKGLLLSRSKLVEDSEHMESDAHYNGKNGEGLTFNHLADAGSDTFEMDFSMEQLENKEKLVHEIDEALERIEKKVYGLCETCSKKIPKSRLLAIPFAKNCLTCQELAEKESN